jgi:hypothetical protein
VIVDNWFQAAEEEQARADGGVPLTGLFRQTGRNQSGKDDSDINDCMAAEWVPPYTVLGLKGTVQRDGSGPN